MASNTTPRSSRPGFRADIEGLRAVAALLVASYHIWFGRVSGGVDVFFLVSAYLITRSLMGQLERTGRISLVAFWSNLARRLLPNAVLVLILVVIAAWIWLPRPLWQDTITQVVASALYIENWQLAFSAVDYLEQGITASPVQHFWALSIQGQFYLLWPLLVTATVAIAAVVRLQPRRALRLVFAALFITSLAYSVWATAANQPFAYFNTLARLWEFSAGALLALAPALPMPRSARVLLGWTGLLGIVSCGFLFQVSRVFPGYAALWPVGCGAFIILAGHSGSRFGADRLLSLPALVYLGGISYGVYLWHWPLLTYYRWISHHSSLSLLEGCGVLAFAIASAALSTAWVEKPIRNAGFKVERPLQLIGLLALGLAPIALITAGWGAYTAERRQHDQRIVDAADPDYPGARAREEGFVYTGKDGVPLYPGMLAVADDLPVIYSDGCYKPDPYWQRERCIYGDATAKRTIALVGGSHSVHWLPALDMMARREGWKVLVYTKANCLFSEAIDRITQDEWCADWNEKALRILLEDRPDVIFTTSTRGSGDEEHVPRGFLQRWEKLSAAGIQVIAVRDTPWMQFWVPQCLEHKGHESPECAQPALQMLAAQSPVLDVEAPDNVDFIDMTPYFCDAAVCPPVIGNVVVYRDDSHITAAYSRSLAPMLWSKLAPFLPTDPTSAP